jgi:hypothetical protein
VPVDYAGTGAAGDDEWSIAGRVVAVPFAHTVLLAEGAHRIQISGEVGDLRPGDLVRVRAVVDAAPEELVVPPDPSFPVYRALAVELVFRPTRAPLGPETETRVMIGDALRQRLALRAAVFEKIREYFKRQQFLEVETPAIATCPGLDLHLTPSPCSTRRRRRATAGAIPTRAAGARPASRRRGPSAT